MQVRILNDTKERLEIEISGEDHTLGNYLRASLLANPKVKHAGYQIVHPLTGGIKVVVQTADGYSPREAFSEALSKMESEASEFKDKLRKALK